MDNRRHILADDPAQSWRAFAPTGISSMQFASWSRQHRHHGPASSFGLPRPGGLLRHWRIGGEARE
eukprot:9290115-Lingulodinium_polyedra.AAC.1